MQESPCFSCGENVKTEYYRTAPFNPAKETYDLYKAFAEAFRENEREEQESQEELKKAVNKAYGNGYTPDGIVLILAEPNKKRGQ